MPKSQRYGLVFPSSAATKGPQLSRKRVIRIISDIGKRARVVTEATSGKTATSHEIGRRAFLTRMVNNGYSEDEARQVARHASVETTRAYYLQRDAKRLAMKLGWAER